MASSPGQIRPWRLLASFVVVVGVLYSLVFFTGDGSATPKLGIDLQGGTRVTLEARTETGAEAPRDQLLLAQQIIQQRVDGLGVGGSEVVLDGNNLTITVPGDDGEQARSLGQTAQLRFREVVGTPIPAVPPVDAPADAVPEDAAPEDAAPAETAPGEPTPAETPQGAGQPVVEADVEPVARTSPLDTPEPTPPPADPATPQAGVPDAPADPELAAAIAQAREVRQNPAILTDPAAAQAALDSLDCAANDPLQGYDDPSLPLVACDQDGTAKYVLSPNITDSQGRALEGTMIAGAQAVPAPGGIGTQVSLSWTSEGASIWGDYTTNNVGQRTAFVLDGEVVSAPTIQVPIFGDTSIEGQFTPEEAQDLAGVLRYGSLPLSFTSSEAQTVSATLGLASLQAGLIAGGIGLLLVFVYCLIYYRVLGLLTILSLILSGVVVYAVLILLGRWIGFTLDLAGVAGFIVAIGITADSFVIFFERLKDEMREGRTFRSAVPRGWVRARRTILAADAVSFLAAVVLYVLAVGQVKGFAFTLGLSTVLDLIVVFLVTHPLVALASKSKTFSKPSISGLGSAARMGAEYKKAESAKKARSAKNADSSKNTDSARNTVSTTKGA
ncbi:protein translocase subunit SecD [Pseudonocardia sp.]|uniref:protein translocase subunit SecD n=1 Tax=Pseudonocardia sp. TaxID=60912 RepID=UPI002608D1E4|nr:protein translocase subunit SecD [Pseudonocardia sp.]